VVDRKIAAMDLKAFQRLLCNFHPPAIADFELSLCKDVETRTIYAIERASADAFIGNSNEGNSLESMSTVNATGIKEAGALWATASFNLPFARGTTLASSCVDIGDL
jgi:hypothetical protein